MFKFPWRDGEVRAPRQIWINSYDKSGTIVGRCIGITDGEVTYLTDLFVAEAERGQGHGTYLMEWFIKRAGSTTIILLTTGAADFYRKFGFVERTAMVRRPE